jgi:hypothetical protein
MITRGKVLRAPLAEPGLLMVEGQQYKFALEGVWKSDVPAKPGLVVNVDLDANGRVQSMTVVPDSQLAKEQAEAKVALARHASGTLTAEFGISSLIAAAVLVVAWLFLTAVSIQVPILGILDFTFWQLLGFLNHGAVLVSLDQSDRPSPGFYGFLAGVALAGPFLHHFWKDKRALLGGLMPLLFMLIVGIAVRGSIENALIGAPADGAYAPAMKQARDEAMKTLTLGLGAYLSILVGLYFAFTATKQFMVSKASERQELPPARKAA